MENSKNKGMKVVNSKQVRKSKKVKDIIKYVEEMLKEACEKNIGDPTNTRVLGDITHYYPVKPAKYIIVDFNISELLDTDKGKL